MAMFLIFLNLFCLACTFRAGHCGRGGGGGGGEGVMLNAAFAIHMKHA